VPRGDISSRESARAIANQVRSVSIATHWVGLRRPLGANLWLSLGCNESSRPRVSVRNAAKSSPSRQPAERSSQPRSVELCHCLLLVRKIWPSHLLSLPPAESLAMISTVQNGTGSGMKFLQLLRGFIRSDISLYLVIWVLRANKIK
jgi:hypothetical protein